ncbi:MAG TPA: Rieske 2Fe-2S domain-containing protein [Chloroflexota bacterium]
MAVAIQGPAGQRMDDDYADFEHTGPGTLGGRYLRLFWHPIYVAEQLKPGWTVPLKIMSEEFTLYRGEQGGPPHLVEQRCAHRGTQLSVGWVEGDQLRCRYHGWKYDGTGQCVEAPLEDPSLAPQIKIKSYPVVEYLGLIFAYLGEGEAPPPPHHPGMELEGVIEASCFVRHANYMHELENDSGHVPFTHPQNYGGLPPKGTFNLTEVQPEHLISKETRWGLTRSTVTEVHHIAPNIHATGRNYRELKWMVPIDDYSYCSFATELSPATGDGAKRRENKAAWAAKGFGNTDYDLIDSVVAGKVRLEDLDKQAPGYLINIQDGAVQIGQGPIRDKTQGHLGRSDIFIVILRKIKEREQRALAEGRPLKQWDPESYPWPANGDWPAGPEDPELADYMHLPRPSKAPARH